MAVSPEFFGERIRMYLPEPEASLMNGMLLGIPIRNQWELYQDLIRVGLVHMVVLSGMNITLLVEMISSGLFFLPKNTKIVLIIITIGLFTFFVGIQPPILRASIMGIISLCGSRIGRKVSPLYSLLLSAIICLTLFPTWVSSVSFYLSYAATTGIIIVPKPLTIRAKKGKPLSYISKYCIDDLQTSIAAQVFTLPIIWYYFGRISLISPITNLFVSWTVAPIMALGFLISLISLVAPQVLKPLTFAADVLLRYILYVVHVFA